MLNQRARGSGQSRLAVAAPGRIRDFLAYLGTGGRADRILPRARRASLCTGTDSRCDDGRLDGKSPVKPYLARILVYPIKSLGPASLGRVRVLEGAGLAGDREYALLDARGRVLNTKRLRDALLSIRARYPEGTERIEVRSAAGRLSCGVADSLEELGEYFGRALGERVLLGRDSALGYFDDMEATGPTVLGSESIASVAGWFGLAQAEVRRRFRANLEIAGLEPFEEDLLFGRPGQPRRFRIGDVEFLGTNPCARCIVPTLDSAGGAGDAALQPASFAELRRRHSRADSELGSYGHYYRLAVNTLLAPNQGGKRLAVGDELMRLSD